MYLAPIKPTSGRSIGPSLILWDLDYWSARLLQAGGDKWYGRNQGVPSLAQQTYIFLCPSLYLEGLETDDLVTEIKKQPLLGYISNISRSFILLPILLSLPFSHVSWSFWSIFRKVTCVYDSSTVLWWRWNQKMTHWVTMSPVLDKKVSFFLQMMRLLLASGAQRRFVFQKRFYSLLWQKKEMAT